MKRAADTREKEIQLYVCMFVCGERDDLVCYKNAKERGDLFWSFDYFASNYRSLSVRLLKQF